MTLVFAGVAIGVGYALASTRLMKTMLFGVSTTDGMTFVLVAVLLIAVCMLACWLPTRRATQVDPLLGARHE